ncbi:MAG: hypothetical protein E7658_09425 [Ruminococcaceae bacterium]|nr:hypothetical protein [Oscillospiraceae bacterium]
MTEKERFARIFAHKEADRVPIIDSVWTGTIRRWHAEGMPKDVDWIEYFGIDNPVHIHVDNSPRYPYKVLEENEKNITYSTNWGVTVRKSKEIDSTPEFLDFIVTDRTAWEECKRRMYMGEDRIDWKWLQENYDSWQAQGKWIIGDFWFGFDVTHSHMMGTENLLMAMYEEPDLIMEMFDTYLNRSMELCNQVWDAGYHFDSIFWYDDMGYKGNMFFSNEMYREMLKPFHKRAIDWAHERGIYAHLHSCGYIMPRIDDLVEIGLDCLNPLEIKAGMDPLLLKEKYGDKLVLHGGINAVLWEDTEAVIEEIRRLVPKLKENGGYIFSSDHSIHNRVSLDTFKAIVDEIKRVGAY